MAEILLRTADRDTDHPMAYRRGDFVAIKPDGHEWGREETQANGFLIIAISGVAVEKLEKFLAPVYDPITGGQAERRRFRLALASLPAGVRSRASAKGRLVATWAEIRDYLADRKTGETFAGRDP